MKVREMMSADVKSCGEQTDLASVAQIMWDGDCGIVPVVNSEHQLVGVITDRDICIAAATRASSPASIRAQDVMSRVLATCVGDDDAAEALETLKNRRIRRLPVVDDRDRLIGVLSVNDLISRAELRRGAEIAGEDVLDTLKAICAHPSRPVTTSGAFR